MKSSILFILLISLLTIGCSAKKTNQKEASVDLSELDDTPIEDVNSDSIIPLEAEVLSETEPEEDELIVVEQEEAEPFSMFDGEQSIADVSEDDQELEQNNEDGDLVTEAQELTKVIEKSEYVVQKNDTLMLVAWKVYGDHSKWRELESLNQDKIHNGNIWTGEKISFERPEVEFNWSPEGDPYLLKNGDTLGLVSKNVYGKAKHWKAIWYNNRDLIRNPNLIFAGFTIFYKDIEVVNEREIASKFRLYEKEK